MRVYVIDSGRGGLTIAKEISALLPCEITLVADALYFPYGAKKSDELLQIVRSLVETCLTLGEPDALVIACNTASTLLLDQLRALFPFPIVGVVPAIKPAGLCTKTGVFAVLATANTCNSHYLIDLKHQFAPHQTMITQSAPGLVQLAESFHRSGGEKSQKKRDLDLLRAELAPLFCQQSSELIDVLVLACTHFPLLKEPIGQLLPEFTDQTIQILDSGAAVAKQVQRVLPTQVSSNNRLRGEITLYTRVANTILRKEV